MNIIKFPTKLPTPEELDLPRIQLLGLLDDIASKAQTRSEELLTANTATELASIVHEAASDAADVLAGWEQLSKMVRAWGL